MSQLPAEALSYQTVVTEYFLGLRGVGLMLSPLDQELVLAWERRGLPVAVVCAGLRQGLEDARRELAPEGSLPRSLRAYRRSVESAWRAHRAARVGSAPPPPSESSAAAARLAAARDLVAQARASAPAHLRQAYRVASAALAGILGGDRDVSGLGGDREGSTLGGERERPGDGAECGEEEVDGDRVRGGALGGDGAPTLAGVEAALRRADALLLHAWLRTLPSPERAALGPRCRLRAGAREALTRPASYREALRAHLEDSAREAGLLRLRGSV